MFADQLYEYVSKIKHAQRKLVGLFGELSEDFEKIHAKVAKVSDLYAEISEGYDHGRNFEHVFAKAEGLGSDFNQDVTRVSKTYKYLTTLFATWASNIKSTSQHFELMFTPITCKSIQDLNTLNEVLFLSQSAAKEATRPSSGANSPTEKTSPRIPIISSKNGIFEDKPADREQTGKRGGGESRSAGVQFGRED